MGLWFLIVASWSCVFEQLRFIKSSFSHIRLNLKVPWIDNLKYFFLISFKERFNENVSLKNISMKPLRWSKALQKMYLLMHSKVVLCEWSKIENIWIWILKQTSIYNTYILDKIEFCHVYKVTFNAMVIIYLVCLCKCSVHLCKIKLSNI